ncbi:MAG: phosphoglucomutase/phosphomannomutase family protein [Clostridia bacterium]|nr:phosphoglucomutase/phosphomannomutase family protein [Clostridia bacterium]
MVKFGTGGWRAIIGDEFIKSNITLLAQAVSDIINEQEQNKTVIMGFDKRFLSDKAAVWSAEVFAANGITVNFIDRPVPTPMVMFGVKSLGAPYGMAVTASHNPAEYNGIKLFTAGGRDASKEFTDFVEEKIASVKKVSSIPFKKGVESGVIRITNLSNDYIDSILAQIDVEAIKKKNLRVLLDPMFGVSKTSLQTVLSVARCEVNVINDRHDTLFGGKLPSPSAKTLEKLQAMVVNEGYDIGIGTDGDADRIGIIDEKGNFVHPNRILELLYYYFLKYKGKRGAVVRNIATTCVLDRIAADFGCDCIEVPVGFKHISAGMEKYDAIIGGESSGGLTIKGHIKGKDGILASAILVEMISVTGKKIGELLQEIDERYGEMVMVEDDLRLDEERVARLKELLFVKKETPAFSEKVKSLCYDDGLKVRFENGGWIIVRFSGTEPLLRIFCEMPSESAALAQNEIAKNFCKSI